MKLDPPLLTRGGLTGRIFVVTHGKVEPHPTREGETMVTASVKYDVTEQFQAPGRGRGEPGAMSDPNAGSLVLFKRYGCPIDSPAFASQSWALGRIVDTFFVDETLWATIDPEKPEGRSAPTTLTVPLNEHHIDPIVHGMDLPGGGS